MSTNNTLNEWREFALFSSSAQRYIKRSLDIALHRGNALQQWARDEDEAYSIRAQIVIYSKLPTLRNSLPSSNEIYTHEPFFASLVSLSTFDLEQGRLDSFSSYRFLYERLLTAKVRRWLPSSFYAAAAMPNLESKRRKKLLKTISEEAATAPGWSDREPIFYPEWVEKIKEIT